MMAMHVLNGSPRLVNPVHGPGKTMDWRALVPNSPVQHSLGEKHAVMDTYDGLWGDGSLRWHDSSKKSLSVNS